MNSTIALGQGERAMLVRHFKSIEGFIEAMKKLDKNIIIGNDYIPTSGDDMADLKEYIKDTLVPISDNDYAEGIGYVLKNFRGK